MNWLLKLFRRQPIEKVQEVPFSETKVVDQPQPKIPVPVIADEAFTPDVPLSNKSIEEVPLPPKAENEISIPEDVRQEVQHLSQAVDDIWNLDTSAMSFDEKRAHYHLIRRRIDSLVCGMAQNQFLTVTNLPAMNEKLCAWEDQLDDLVSKKSDTGSAIVLVLDTETTGLEEYDEPISVGAIMFEVALPSGQRIREITSYYGLRQPNVPMNPRAQAVHGISIESLRGKCFRAGTLRELVEKSDVLIAHNAKFDRRMLSKVLPGIENLTWACSMLSLRDYWQSYPGRSLDILCEALNVERPSVHHAMADCRALSELLFHHSGSTKRSRTYMSHLAMRPWTPP